MFRSTVAKCIDNPKVLALKSKLERLNQHLKHVVNRLTHKYVPWAGLHTNTLSRVVTDRLTREYYAQIKVPGTFI